MKNEEKVPDSDLDRKFEFRKYARPHPRPLPQAPQERERPHPILHTLPISVAVGAALLFVSEAARPPNALISTTRGRRIHPLLGERVGVRASVPLISISPFLSNTLAQSDRPSAFGKVNSARAGLLGHWLQQRESFCHASPVQSALAHSQTLSRRPCDESEEFLGIFVTISERARGD